MLGPPTKPLIEEAPKMELKAMAAHLIYAFLGKDKVILSTTLSDEQVEVALLILKRRKAALYNKCLTSMELALL